MCHSRTPQPDGPNSPTLSPEWGWVHVVQNQESLAGGAWEALPDRLAFQLGLAWNQTRIKGFRERLFLSVQSEMALAIGVKRADGRETMGCNIVLRRNRRGQGDDDGRERQRATCGSAEDVRQHLMTRGRSCCRSSG